MVIKKVTVKFDSCKECPIMMYVGCAVAYSGVNDTKDPLSENCPIDTTATINRFTDYPRSRGDATNGEIE
jgi:hypothetical protein